jgi:hypothetical protein
MYDWCSLDLLDMAKEHRPAGIKSSRHLGSVTTYPPLQPQDAKLVINWVWSAKNNFQEVQNLFTISHKCLSINMCSFSLSIFADLLERVNSKILNLFPV